MKTRLRISFLFLLCLSVFLCLSTAAHAESGTWGTLKWTLNNGVLTISGSGEMQDFSSYDSTDAWRAHKQGIRSIVINEGVKNISAYAFSNFFDLNSVLISESVSKIGNYAFGWCYDLPNVTIPSSVVKIGRDAFVNCSSLINVTIPENVTSIGTEAFGCCRRLKNISVNSNNKNYCDVDGVLYSKDKKTLFQFPNAKIGIYTIPNSVTSIGDSAFEWCEGLTSVTIPDSVTSIGSSAFSACTALTNIIIPDSVTDMGEYAFHRCENLKSVKISNSLTDLDGWSFSWCFKITNIIIPNSIKTISYKAFERCESLSSVTIPNSVTKIYSDVFEGCISLTDVFFLGTEQQWKDINIYSGNEPLLNADIHYQSSGLDLILPASLTAIEPEAFAGGAFTSVQIPPSVTSIAPNAFGDKTGLTIFGKSGSYAQTYAEKKGFSFIPIA